MTNRCGVASGSATTDGRLAWGVMLVCLALQGCASTDAAREAPLELSVTLNRADYRIGDPLIATVTLENKAEKPMDVPRFDVQSARFMTGEKGLHVRVHREPVHSKTILPVPHRMEPTRSVTRSFVLTRVTMDPGEFALMASFKGVIVDGEYVRKSVYAAPRTYKVGREVAFRRDRGNGLILKEQAEELARANAKGEVKKTRAVLMPLGDTGLFTWIVMVRAAENGGERSYAVEVNPYLGSVKPVVSKGEKSAAPALGPADRAIGTTTRPTDRTGTENGPAGRAQLTGMER